MTVMTTKEELLEFYKNKEYWPETDKSFRCVNEETLLWGEKFTQQTVFELDALQALPSGTKIKIDGGYVWDEANDFSIALESYFKRWRNEQANKGMVTMNFVTVFDKNDEAAIRAAIEAAGGKIL
jgi:hypothetical protein